jgi:fumarate reductase subunit D
MAVMKIPRHFGSAHLAKAGMMIGRHFVLLAMNLPLWFGSDRPEQARLSSMIHSPASPTLCHRNAFQKSLFPF